MSWIVKILTSGEERRKHKQRPGEGLLHDCGSGEVALLVEVWETRLGM